MPAPTYLPPPDLQSAKQVEKLELEIASLQKKNRWETLAQFIPVLTAGVAVLGFFFTVIVFQSQQATEQEKARSARELERTTALQNQIRGDTDEILRFPGDPKLSVARVAFLLSDIRTVLESPENQGKLAVTFPGYKDSLTRSLVVLVANDCDFSRHPRDVELANAIETYWCDYSEYLRTESQTFEKLDYILFEYTRALQTLRDENPGYLQSMYLDKDGFEPGAKYKRLKDEHLLYVHFIDIIDGFKTHLDILSRENTNDAKQLKRTQIQEFEGALCNPVISKDQFGSDYLGAPCNARP